MDCEYKKRVQTLQARGKKSSASRLQLIFLAAIALVSPSAIAKADLVPGAATQRRVGCAADGRIRFRLAVLA
jgi:hypothetical protein